MKFKGLDSQSLTFIIYYYHVVKFVSFLFELWWPTKNLVDRTRKSLRNARTSIINRISGVYRLLNLKIENTFLKTSKNFLTVQLVMLLGFS